MRIENVTVNRNAAVTIAPALFGPFDCDLCLEESGRVQLEIKHKNISFNAYVGEYCAKKYLEMFL